MTSIVRAFRVFAYRLTRNFDMKRWNDWRNGK